MTTFPDFFRQLPGTNRSPTSAGWPKPIVAYPPEHPHRLRQDRGGHPGLVVARTIRGPRGPGRS